ncbi:hypothetical protein [Streptomyces sp. SID1034]|nr:hypothetical protein [Streptomyces sp. SID1034]MYV88861.1 hypothetical protein [Streptomyces sp. SID1034]
MSEPEPIPCGESGCYCHGTTDEHADCACDCPRCWNCLQKTDNCDC